MNVKLRVGDSDKILNLGEIVADKLAFYYIANLLNNIPVHGTIASDYPVIFLVILVVPSLSGFFNLGSAALGFPAPGCFAPDLFVLLIPGSPAFPWLGSFVVPLVSLDAFCHDPFLTLFVDSGTIKLQAEVIANLFSNNSSIITYFSHDSCTSEQACMTFEVGVANSSLAIFNT